MEEAFPIPGHVGRRPSEQWARALRLPIGTRATALGLSPLLAPSRHPQRTMSAAASTLLAASCSRPSPCSSLRKQPAGLGRANARPQQLRAGRSIASRRPLSVVVRAKGKAGDPPDVPKPRDQRQGGREWLQSILSRFGPVKEKASNTTVLDFEKPLVELDNRIREVSGAGAAPRSPTTHAAAAAHPLAAAAASTRACWPACAGPADARCRCGK